MFRKKYCCCAGSSTCCASAWGLLLEQMKRCFNILLLDQQVQMVEGAPCTSWWSHSRCGCGGQGAAGGKEIPTGSVS
jgi:hypothetical protein